MGVRLRADWVLPMCAPAVRDGAVAIRGGRIVAVGPARRVATEAPDLPERDLGAAIVLPGFVDAHCHLEWSLAPMGMGGAGFTAWLTDILALGADMSPDDFVAAARYGALRCVEHGTTTVADSGPTGAGAAALHAAGLRGIVHLETFGRHVGDAARDAAAEHAARVAALDGGPNVRIGVAPHAPYTVGPEYWHALASHPELVGRPWTTHLAESEDETLAIGSGDGPLAELFAARGSSPGRWPGSGGPIRRLSDAGLLRRGLVAAHCVHLDDGDASRLAEKGVSVAHCPISNRALGVGRAPFQPLRDAGVAVGLGTDSPASGGDFDLRAEARAFGHLHGISDAQTLLAQITVDAAAALGMHDVAKLTPGAVADLVVIDPFGAVEDPFAAALHRDAPVRTVFVGGEIVFDEGRSTRMDHAAVVDAAEEVRAR